MSDIREQAPLALTEIGNVEGEGGVISCREYIVFDRTTDRLYDLTAGTSDYVEELVRLSPDYATEHILVVDPHLLADADVAADQISRTPNLGEYLIEQAEPDQADQSL